MARPDLDRISGKKQGCPSELDLDRMSLGELSRRERTAVERHLKGCPDCRERLSLRREGMAAFPELDKEAMVLSIQKRLLEEKGVHGESETSHERDSRTRRAPRSWTPVFGSSSIGRLFRSRPGGILGTAAALSLVLIAVHFGWRITGSGKEEGLRLKGKAGLRVYRESGGRVEEMASGGRVHAGDRLRFRVDLPVDGHLMVVGQENSGDTYPCFPAEGMPESRRFSAGFQGELPGAVRLDGSSGEERLILLLCKEPFALADVHEILGREPGEVASGCISTTFRMIKE